MNYFILSACILLSVGGLFSLTRQLQMLQQSSYFISRYAKWLKGAVTKKIILPILSLIAALVLYFFDYYILLLILCTLSALTKIISARSMQKKSIKPLVYTIRIKRMYITAGILFLLLCTLCMFLNRDIFFTAICVLSFISPITAVLARTVNTPLDNFITSLYIKDAKKKLKNHNSLTVIGITGSYGKTSTKYILASFLEQKYNVLYTPASFNTPMGIVRTVREGLRPQTEIFIAEMGAKNVGDIKECCSIADPKIGIITSVGPQHLDTFKTIDNVLKTKFELCDYVLSKGGSIYLGCDSNLIAKKADGIKATTFGANGEVSYSGISYSEKGLQFDITYPGGALHIKTKLLGSHNAANITAAAAVALNLGVKPKDIEFAAAKLKAVSHRLEMKSFIGGSTLLDDAYNANPEGSLKAVDVLSKFDGKKKIIVTPGLVELGEKEYECNYNLGLAAAKVCDTIILVGKLRAKPMESAVKDCGFEKELIIVSKFSEAMEHLRKIVDKNTVVLFENDLPDNYAK